MRTDGREKRSGEYVLCPLFISFTDNEIKCQSHMPEATSTIIKYSNVKSCRMQRNIFCEGCYKRCEHYRAWEHFAWRDDDE